MQEFSGLAKATEPLYARSLDLADLYTSYKETLPEGKASM
jgi:hypothetical protein